MAQLKASIIVATEPVRNQTSTPKSFIQKKATKKQVQKQAEQPTALLLPPYMNIFGPPNRMPAIAAMGSPKLRHNKEVRAIFMSNEDTTMQVPSKNQNAPGKVSKFFS